MICENCLYNKNCQFLLKHKNEEVEGCTAFEDKAEWVHLPCRVGDRVFSIIVVGGEPTIVADHVSGFIIVGDTTDIITDFYLDGGEWGYNIFPTQKKAGKALEKRRRNK